MEVQEVVETADKSLSALITAETIECGTEMEVQPIVETADKSLYVLITADTAECGTETEVAKVVETFDKSLSALITAETIECGTEMEVQPIVETADKSLYVLITADTAECGTETEVAKVVETFDKSLSALITAETIECGTEMEVQPIVETADKSFYVLITAETAECGTETEVAKVVETSDKSLSVLITAETIECGTEMEVQPIVETVDKSLSALITAETAECGTEMAIQQLVDDGTMYDLSTSELGTITDQLGLDMGMNTDQQELTSVGCNTSSLPTVADAGVEVNLMEKLARPVVTSVSTSIDLDDNFSRTVGVGSCSVYDRICDRCTNLVTCSVAVGSSDSPTSSTRTIGTNHSMLTKTIGVGLCKAEYESAFISKAVGDRNIDELLCNICDQPLMKTVSTEITGPQTCDHAVGTAAVPSQITEGVGDCTLTDRLCEHCDTVTVSSVGVGNSDINHYTKTQGVQVGFFPIESPVSQSSVDATLERPDLSQLHDILASYCPDTSITSSHEHQHSSDLVQPYSVFHPQYPSSYHELSSPEDDPESLIQREFVTSEKAAVINRLQMAPTDAPTPEMGNNNVPKAGYEEIPDGTDEWHRQEGMLSFLILQ